MPSPLFSFFFTPSPPPIWTTLQYLRLQQRDSFLRLWLLVNLRVNVRTIRLLAMSETAQSARGIVEGTSAQVQGRTRGALETVKQSWPVQGYIVPTFEWLRAKYNRSPMIIRITVATFGILGAIPLACFFGFMGVVTLGCLIVGGIGASIVEVSQRLHI